MRFDPTFHVHVNIDVDIDVHIREQKKFFPTPGGSYCRRAVWVDGYTHGVWGRFVNF
jgi:hypothetical protein